MAGRLGLIALFWPSSLGTVTDLRELIRVRPCSRLEATISSKEWSVEVAGGVVDVGIEVVVAGAAEQVVDAIPDKTNTRHARARKRGPDQREMNPNEQPSQDTFQRGFLLQTAVSGVTQETQLPAYQQLVTRGQSVKRRGQDFIFATSQVVGTKCLPRLTRMAA